MSAGGIESVRIGVSWALVEPSPPEQPAASGDATRHRYRWDDIDRQVEVAASHGLEILPFLYSTPSWLAKSDRTLPTRSKAQRHAWSAFVRAAVRRYGPEATSGSSTPRCSPASPAGTAIRTESPAGPQKAIGTYSSG